MSFHVAERDTTAHENAWRAYAVRRLGGQRLLGLNGAGKARP